MQPYIISAGPCREVVLATKEKGVPRLRGHRQMLTLNLPPDLVAKVDVRATKERRSRANMLEVTPEERFGREVQREEAAY